MLEDSANACLSPRMRQLVGELRVEWKLLDAKIEAPNGEFVETTRHNETMRRLTSVPGIGVLNATALVAALRNGSGFSKARDLGGRPRAAATQHRRQGMAVRHHQARK